MIESRCGILCSSCGYAEKMNCKGCVAISRPFWGESCQIKSCCEEKNLSHCGCCDDFPCEVLVQFAFDPKDGDDGRRIEQCRAWAKGKA